MLSCGFGSSLSSFERDTRAHPGTVPEEQDNPVRTTQGGRARGLRGPAAGARVFRSLTLSLIKSIGRGEGEEERMWRRMKGYKSMKG